MQWSHTRREFLTAAVGANVAVLLAPAWLRAQTDAEDPRVARVLADIIGIDMHNHVTPAEARPQQGPKEQQKSQPTLELADEIKRSGLTAVCAAFRLDFNASDPYATFLRGLTAIDGLLGKDRLTRALNLKDLQTAHQKGQPAIVQSIEGAHFLEGHLDRVDEVYKHARPARPRVCCMIKSRQSVVPLRRQSTFPRTRSAWRPDCLSRRRRR